MTPAEHQSLLAAVRRIIEANVGESRRVADAGADTPLGEGYWLDSGELLNVVLACELEFDITFDEAGDFGHGEFATLGSLTELVRRKIVARDRRP